MLTILPARCAALCALAIGAVACAGSPTEFHDQFDPDATPSAAAAPGTPGGGSGADRIEIRLQIQAEHLGAADRYRHAALVALGILSESLAPFPARSLTIIDAGRRSSGQSVPSDAVVLARTPWWSAGTAMAPELETARAISRRFWEQIVDTRALPSWFVGGLAEFAARRIVARLFDERYQVPLRSRLEGRYFGGFVAFDLRLAMDPDTDGDPVPAYRANPRVRMVPRIRPSDTGRRAALEAKTLLTLGTLERWLGRPVFDQALAEFARSPGTRQPTIADFARVMNRVSQQDLSWLFDEALASSAVFDYAVTRLESDMQGDGWYHTTVVVRRMGDATFTGASGPRVGSFERGSAVAVVTTFGDAGSIRDVWDGRDREKTLVYRSRTRAVSAEVDPDRILLLDLNRTNNSLTLQPQAATAARRWAARWLLWVEDRLLTYLLLV